MSDERHDEIAARLRAEAGARAPERLRADVMLQVRAEPRPRRTRPRHGRMWRPLGAVAAVACVLAALVFGLSHSTGTSSQSALSTEVGAAVAGGGASRAALPSTASTEKHISASSGRGIVPGTFSNDLERALGPSATATPPVLGYQAANLPPGLRRALENLILTHGRGAH